MKALVVFFISIPMLITGTTLQVDMLNFVFAPESLTVSQGDTVLWINNQGTHTTTSGVAGVPDGLWDSGTMSQGDSFAFVFDTLGTFPYYCTFHWQMGMTGIIFVNPTGMEESESEVPMKFRVGQNYPNPFNIFTTINYELHAPAMTKLVVYNALGQIVRTYVKQYRTPGKYYVMWDGRNNNGQRVSNGVYFYEINIGDDVVQRKMVLIR